MTDAMLGAMIGAGVSNGLGAAPLGGFGDFGSMLLRTIAILVGVCILSYLVIRFVLRRLVLSAAPESHGTKRLALLDRLALDTRRSMAVVKAGGRVLLVGLGEGQLTLLCELDPKDWPDRGAERTPSRFHKRLRAALGRPRTEPSLPCEDRIALRSEAPSELSPSEGDLDGTRERRL